jgi:hypothetical protein
MITDKQRAQHHMCEVALFCYENEPFKTFSASATKETRLTFDPTAFRFSLPSLMYSLHFVYKYSVIPKKLISSVLRTHAIEVLAFGVEED